MAFGLGGSKNKSSSSSNYSQDVWGPQGNAMQDMYGQFGNMWDNTYGQMNNMMPSASQGMQDVSSQTNPYWQNQMQGGAYKDMGLQDQLMGSLNQSMQQPSAKSEINAMIMGGEGNNYADAMRDQYVKDANRTTDNMMSNLDARAAASGMSGGSRHGIAQAKGMENINDQLQGMMANTGYQTFDKDLDRKLEIAGQADAGNLARQQMMSGMIDKQNTTMGSGLNFGSNMQNMNMGQFAPYMMPWQMGGQYANMMGDPTILGSGSSSGKSSGFGLSGSSS